MQLKFSGEFLVSLKRFLHWEMAHGFFFFKFVQINMARLYRTIQSRDHGKYHAISNK